MRADLRKISMSSYPSWRQMRLIEQETGDETGEMPLTGIEEDKSFLRSPSLIFVIVGFIKVDLRS